MSLIGIYIMGSVWACLLWDVNNVIFLLKMKYSNPSRSYIRGANIRLSMTKNNDQYIASNEKIYKWFFVERDCNLI